jgi:hypothetical protein
MKPGYQTTEFMMTLIVTLGAFAYVGFKPASENVWGDVSAIVVAGLSVIGYTAQRFQLKREYGAE